MLAINERYLALQGKINKTAISLIQNASYQFTNMFELVLYPYTLKTLNLSALSQIAIDSALIKTSLMSVSNIPSPKIETEVAGYEKYITTITPPEEMTMIFCETELGAVFNWLDIWKKAIYKSHPVFKRVFSSNQDATKKNGYLTLHSKSGIPVPYVWKITGLKFKNFADDISLSHEEGAPLLVGATFEVDDVELITLEEFVMSAII